MPRTPRGTLRLPMISPFGRVSILSTRPMGSGRAQICRIPSTIPAMRSAMHLDGYVDVLIPRGGAGLIRAVAKEASVPVIRTGEGVCHIYVDSEANLDMAGFLTAPQDAGIA